MTMRKLCLPLIAAAGLAACSDNDNRSFPPDPPPPPVQTATERLIELAAQTDEVGEPFPVNDGAFVFNDTVEDTEPVAINR
jgi:hypothetical protein